MRKNTQKKWAAAGTAAGTAAVLAFAQKKWDDIAQQTDGRGQTVLITGASGGIGRNMAFVFAQHHFDIVAVARNEEKLAELKLELENSYDIHVTTIARDLSDETAAKEIFEKTQEAGIHVEQLVNNAGAGKQAKTTDADPEVMKSLIRLNVTSPTMLCRYFGREMVKRGHGRILNVSSMGAFIPDPYFNVYGPTKAYELFLTEAMYGELKGTGVSVSALCPGPTRTNWAANAGKADAGFAKDPAEVAEAGFIGMQEGQLIIIPDADYRAIRLLMRPLPAKLQAGAIAFWQKRLIQKK